MIRLHDADEVDTHRDQILDIVDAWCTAVASSRR
jgi:hypothetical protein